MADEFQNRKDIETLYNLIYARTSDSPVTQKDEFDEFKTEISETFDLYVLAEEYYEKISLLSEEIEELKQRVDELTPTS